MNKRKYNQQDVRVCTLAVFFLVVQSMLFCEPAGADVGVIEFKEKAGRLWSEKSASGFNVKKGDADGIATTAFGFHPAKIITKKYTKTYADSPTVAPDPIVHEYGPGEEHGTTGSATYDFDLQLKNKKYYLQVDITGIIACGDDGTKVSLKATASDPVTFSDTELNATFEFCSDGIDDSFSLLEGTAFPEVFSTGPTEYGAIAEETFMEFAERVAPSFISDPSNFWNSMPANAIDLYSLSIGTDTEYNIAVDLVFGASNVYFDLDFKDWNGNPFDPTNPAEVGAIEDYIAAGFLDGVVLTDLSEIFTVGFIPTGMTSEFTLGGQDGLNLSGPEPIPEPATVALLGLGGLLLRRRKSA